MLEERTVGSDSAPATLQCYIYSNHLSTASLELDENAAIISYEEYHPYGTTSYQAMNATINAVAKRYRYTGKERDEETGLYYHGARYFIPWLCRWSAVDPINSEWYNLCQGKADRNLKRQHVELTASSYEYCYANPVRFTDPTGEQAPPSNPEVRHTSSNTQGASTSSPDVKTPKVHPNVPKPPELTDPKNFNPGGKQVPKTPPKPPAGILKPVGFGILLFVVLMFSSGGGEGRGQTLSSQPFYQERVQREIELHHQKPKDQPEQKPKDDDAQVRVQLQQGYNHIEDDVQRNLLSVGVTKQQGYASLKLLYTKAVLKDPSLLFNKDFYASIIRTSQWIKSIPAGVGVAPSGRTSHREQFEHKKKIYRIDLEVKRGVNFKF